jgi:hypothetical protein
MEHKKYAKIFKEIQSICGKGLDELLEFHEDSYGECENLLGRIMQLVQAAQRPKAQEQEGKEKPI